MQISCLRDILVIHSSIWSNSVLEGTKDQWSIRSHHWSIECLQLSVVLMHGDLDSLHAIAQSNRNAPSSSSRSLMFIAEGPRETTDKLRELVPKYATCIVTTISHQP